MKKHIFTAVLYTVVTGFALGIVYPLLVTGAARILFRDKADGQLIVQGGDIIGSRLIGQPFSGPGFFHSRPSAAGTGYDASSSSGSNLGPTSKALSDRIASSVSSEGGEGAVPIDLVTTSASGLDPDISPAAALYQVHRVALQRGLPESLVRETVLGEVTPRQLGLLGEPRVNVVDLNLALLRIQTNH